MAKRKIREGEVINKVANDCFSDFDCTKLLGDVDFCVSPKYGTQTQVFGEESFLWAEAKKGTADYITSIVQLILTIGKARTFDSHLPPAYLGAFDAEKIAFIPYNDIQDVFYINDFNWNVTPSNYETKEFKQLQGKVSELIEKYSLIFYYDKDPKDLKSFIKTNFILGKSSTSKIQIDKNNFIVIYSKWLIAVKPTITVNWEAAKKSGIIDGDFYLADLLSRENETLKEKLYVLLQKDHYRLDRKLDDMGMFSSRKASFTDNQKAHNQFWNKYERPPKEEYWDYIVERRDLLVPQDIRERKGSFFTPQIWVELSQKYLTDVLGEDWQDEYYIWDCAAGTGNLLAGLTNKYNIFASTLDKQDVDVMHSRINTMNKNSISGHGANLLEDHVFQFDFLNDDFDKLPEPLLKIINDPEKRKKLVVYINPPYAEASSRDTVVGTGENKTSVSTKTKVYEDFKSITGTAGRELFAQFFLRVYKEIPNSKLASFSKLKFISSQNFFKFRKYFKAKYEKGFVVPASTFDNVTGNFPISFIIWDTSKKEDITKVNCQVFSSEGEYKSKKRFYAHKKNGFIINWLRNFYDKKSDRLAYLRMQGTDMQNNRGVFFTNNPSKNDIKKSLTTDITQNNVIQMCVYLTVRHIVDNTWLNDIDQFLYPKLKWEVDIEFQNNCLIFAIFNGQNRITSEEGTNHWIPFKEQEVNARAKFESNFMADFIAGKIKKEESTGLFEGAKSSNEPLVFSEEANAVFDEGRELWKYYHSQPNVNVNASLYDIRAHFQGRNAKGRMNSKSDDKKYMELIGNLRNALKLLAKKIEPKVYEYGFLKE
ncbi:hypothetical protein WAF17_02670 [Bernardetia sp. ABR2-2B]|uniref:hypothetical protein n=1 Tax=Bernardetia sp. ABR2-2B TaxID=3127472 RepID=UPI0030CB44B0